MMGRCGNLKVGDAFYSCGIRFLPAAVQTAVRSRPPASQTQPPRQRPHPAVFKVPQSLQSGYRAIGTLAANILSNQHESLAALKLAMIQNTNPGWPIPHYG